MGVPFGTPAPDLHLYSDASRLGWGSHLDRYVSGVWSVQESSLHISLLEMKALFLALQSFQEMVTGHHVTAMCDNLGGDCLRQQAGRDGLRLPLLIDQATSPMGRELRCPVGGEVSSRAVQCSGRPPQPSGSGYRV